MATIHLGRVILHISKNGSEFCTNAKIYVDYCNAYRAAFDADTSIKLEGANLGLAKIGNARQKQLWSDASNRVQNAQV